MAIDWKLSGKTTTTDAALDVPESHELPQCKHLPYFITSMLRLHRSYENLYSPLNGCIIEKRKISVKYN